MSHRHYQMDQADSRKLHVNFVSISLSKDDKDWANIFHTHHFTELFLVVGGKGSFLMPGKTQTVQAGDLVIIPPYVEHTEKSTPGSPLEYYVIGIEGVSFRKENTEELFQSIIHLQKPLMITDLFKQIMYEVQNPTPESRMICQNFLEILILRIMRSQRLIVEPSETEHFMKECAQIKEYLETHYSEPITLDTLTRFTHMSKFYLAHTFTKYVGQSPIQFLNNKRIEIACSQLINTDFSISLIASQSGFTSQSYFSQVFRRRLGMSPSEYKRMYSGRK